MHWQPGGKAAAETATGFKKENQVGWSHISALFTQATPNPRHARHFNKRACQGTRPVNYGKE